MEDKTYEATGQTSRLHTSKKPIYTLFIFVFIFVSSLSVPFRFCFSSLKLTNFLDANDRLYMFVFCNGILLYLFLDSGSKRSSQTRSPHSQAGLEVKQNECNKISESNVDNQIHDDLETELVLHVDYEDKVVITEVEQIEPDGMSVADDHLNTCDQDEDSETEIDVLVDDEHELVKKVEVEEEEHDDQEEANEFNQKCEAFIQKVKQNLRREAVAELEKLVRGSTQ